MDYLNQGEKMKTIILTMLTILSLNLSAEFVTEDLIVDEIELAIDLANKYEVPLSVNGVCTKVEYDIVGTVKSFNAVKWILESEGTSFNLDNEFVAGLVSLRDRLGITSKRVDPITLEARITITGSSCGFSPNKWSATFDERK